VYLRALLNPFRYGAFAWMLASHKLCRWLLPWAMLALVGALAALAVHSLVARLAFIGALGVSALGYVGWVWPEGRAMPRFVALPTYAAAALVAGMHAWIRVATGKLAPTWEPTRRGAAAPPA